MASVTRGTRGPEDRGHVEGDGLLGVPEIGAR